MTPGTCGPPLSCAASWAVARPWQLPARPTLAQAEALSCWTMSNAEGMRVLFCSVLTYAGMPTTVTTVRMPVSCAGHCDPARSADHLFWEPAVASPSSSRKPSSCDNFSSPYPSLLLPGREHTQTVWSCLEEPRAGLYPSTFCVTSPVISYHGPGSVRAPTFCTAKT